MSKSLIIYFSRADENYSVGYIDKGNTEYIAEFVQEMTGADMFKVDTKGLAIRGSQAKNAKKTVEGWL